MKRILIAGAFFALSVGGPALAADLPPPPGPAPVPNYTWGGVYVGINGGGAFGTVNPGAALGVGSFSDTGFLIGPTVGFNYQARAFVFGIEGDWDYSTLNSPATGFGTSVSFSNFKSPWMATARGRVGYAWDRVLLFATGGGAFANVQMPGSSSSPVGWTVGAGVEFAFAQNWTAKAEYLFVDFPSVTLTGVSSKATENAVRGGVNYKFNF